MLCNEILTDLSTAINKLNALAQEFNEIQELISTNSTRKRKVKNSDEFTELQQKIMNSILNGYITDKEISQYLNLSYNKIRYEMKKFLTYFDVMSRPQLLRKFKEVSI